MQSLQNAQTNSLKTMAFSLDRYSQYRPPQTLHNHGTQISQRPFEQRENRGLSAT